jgi:uncharacterized protein (DUF1778 family)
MINLGWYGFLPYHGDKPNSGKVQGLHSYRGVMMKHKNQSIPPQNGEWMVRETANRGADSLPPIAKPERLEARISKAQKDLLQRASALQGRTLTDFVVAAACEAARRTIQDYEILRLGDQDREAFVGALLNPPEPNPALRQAAERYRRRMGV